ncbi:MAG: hypothetical protein KatS3mg068_2112 [Candidatus Sericytochromatia bacterium]|nr:MAG: hypothetical protein KatS3mg068_2112 [Candidatus Sericytochromatia bacterium]
MEIKEKATPSLNLDKNNFETIKLNIPEFDSSDDKLDSLFGDFNNSEINTFVYDKIEKESFFSKLQDIRFSKKVKISLVTLFTITSAIVGINFLSKNENNVNATASTEVENNFKNNIIEIKVKQDKKEEKKQEFVIHKVSPNETLSSISLKYKVSMDDIVKLNNIKNPHFLSLNTELKIPILDKDKVTVIKEEKNDQLKKDEIKKEKNKDEIKKVSVSKEGLFHIIKSGETIGYLSNIYGVSENKILSSNPKINPFNLQIGQKIFIPISINRNLSRKISFVKSSRSLSSLKYQNGRMIWPAKGEFSSAYGYRGNGFHSGIDIANDYGTPIYSAMSGYVISTGWEYDYGKSIKIRHNNGLVTRYAHCSEILVSSGQYVEAGQIIAKMGSTGRSTGPHLHFEVIVNGTPVNPRNYF